MSSSRPRATGKEDYDTWHAWYQAVAKSERIWRQMSDRQQQYVLDKLRGRDKHNSKGL